MANDLPPPTKQQLDDLFRAGQQHAAMVRLGSVEDKAEASAFVQAVQASTGRSHALSVREIHSLDIVTLYCHPDNEPLFKPLFEAFRKGLDATTDEQPSKKDH